MWKVNHPIVESVHKKMVHKIENNNIETVDMYRQANLENMNIPMNNNLIVNDNKNYVMMAT